MKCVICGKAGERAMVFRGEAWCCEHCRKVSVGEILPHPKEWASMDELVYENLIRVWAAKGVTVDV